MDLSRVVLNRSKDDVTYVDYDKVVVYNRIGLLHIPNPEDGISKIRYHLEVAVDDNGEATVQFVNAYDNKLWLMLYYHQAKEFFKKWPDIRNEIIRFKYCLPEDLSIIEDDEYDV